MSSYPIWNDIQACIYKSSKSYGVKEEGLVDIKVGTSARNSYNFLRHVVTHVLHDDGSREYRFYVDRKLIKKAILKKGSDELEIQEPQILWNG